MNDRGQTAQDFAVGVSVLLVTIIGTFAFIQGGGLSVYDSPSGAIEQPQAERVASYLVEEYSVDGNRSVLGYSPTSTGGTTIDDELSATAPDFPALTRAAAVDVASERRTTPTLNVSIVNSSTLQDKQVVPARDSSTSPPTLLAWGPSYENQTAGAATRVVFLRNSDNVECDPVCWLVVRAW